MITGGVDIGSLSANAVILVDNQIKSYEIIPTGADSPATARRVMDGALEKAGLHFDDLEWIVSTGYGRVVVPYANKNITEISCHAKGAHWFFPSVRTILDMGGQDCKAIRCDSNGKATNFVMNDKCAAGAGRSMEVIGKLLDIQLEDIGRLSLNVQDQPAKISSMCVVFARSEILAKVRKGVHKNDILAGACQALADRVISLIQRVGIEEDFTITGGIAKNIGVVRRVEEKLGVRAKICFEPQIVGALGAAIYARDLLKKQKTTQARNIA